jgi:paraquat-inducible protein B
MAKQANRMMIGVFVVVAVTLMAASLVVFGSGKFFQRTQNYVVYFDGSIKGLSVGSPVLWQGVHIGSVTSIVILTDLVKGKSQIPVLLQILPDEFKVVRGERDPKKNLATLIQRGLRAVLVTQSFITGQLAIEVGFYPGTPIVMRRSLDNEYAEYMEIPTIPSTTQRLTEALEKLDLAALEKHLESALDGIAKFVNDPALNASIQGLKETLRDARKLVNRVDRQVDPLARGAKKTVKDVGNLARNLDGRVSGVSTSLDKTLSDARGFISQDSPLIVDLQNTLQELARMSRSIRQLADYLDQHPEALIRGKKKPGGKQ